MKRNNMNNGTTRMTTTSTPTTTATVAAQTMQLVRVTPAMAKDWLEASSGNFRRLDVRRADVLASRIQESGWVLDANPFKFNSRGSLVDGQHRAHAIQRLGVTVTAWVATGVDDDTTIDTGRARSLPQILQSRGEQNYDVLGSTLNYLHFYRKGILGSNTHSAADNRDLLRLLESAPSVRESAGVGARARGCAVGGQIGMLHFVATGMGLGTEANAFCEALTTGANLAGDDPIFHLRRRLLQDRHVSKAKLAVREKLALTIKAWNAWLASRPVSALRWRAVGPNGAEPFPTITVSREAAE